MGLVAVLHLVESVLIRVSGHLNPNPVYVKGKDGRVVGGFALQKFWPLPLVALVYPDPAPGSSPGNCRDALLVAVDQASGEVPGGMELVYILFPVVAALGYGDMALSRTPREKAALSSRYLFAYSIILLVLAVLADSFRSCNMFPPSLPFWGTTWSSRLGIAGSLEASPFFTPALDGLGVLDVFPGGTGHRLGLRPGDVILAVNGHSLLPGDDLRWLPPGPLELLVRREEQRGGDVVSSSSGGAFGGSFCAPPVVSCLCGAERSGGLGGSSAACGAYGRRWPRKCVLEGEAFAAKGCAPSRRALGSPPMSAGLCQRLVFFLARIYGTASWNRLRISSSAGRKADWSWITAPKAQRIEDQVLMVLQSANVLPTGAGPESIAAWEQEMELEVDAGLLQWPYRSCRLVGDSLPEDLLSQLALALEGVGGEVVASPGQGDELLLTIGFPTEDQFIITHELLLERRLPVRPRPSLG